MMEALLKKSLAVNALVVLGISIVLYILFFLSLGPLTRHGSEIKIPNVTNQNIQNAKKTLEDMGFEVLVDSAYEPKQKAYAVLAQMPEVGATVKRGRTVFITINKKEPPMTPMPNIVGLSYRSAEMILKNNKLYIGDTTYKPDIAKGAILEQLYKGLTVRPGQLVPQGSRISLVIGDGLSNTSINMPDVIGNVYPEAIAVLAGTGLQYYAIFEGTITDSSSAIVYKQLPTPLNELREPYRIKEGDMVEIYIRQTATQEELEGNRVSAMPVDPPPAPTPNTN
jgi:beta-lactam-binding protein with PASTA domain